MPPLHSARLLLAWLTLLVLLTLAVSHAVLVVPVFEALLAGKGAPLSLPSRLAVAVAHHGVWLVPLLLIALGVIAWRQRGEPAGGEMLATMLGVANLALVVYIVLLSCVFVDAAMQLPGPAAMLERAERPRSLRPAPAVMARLGS